MNIPTNTTPTVKTDNEMNKQQQHQLQEKERQMGKRCLPTTLSNELLMGSWLVM